MIEPVVIKGRPLGPGHPPLIIAEACINHEGDVAIARKMVHMAHAMGADCIKFQIHVLEDEMLRETPQSDNFDEPLWDTLERTNLTLDEHAELKALCEQLGIWYLCTTFSRKGTDLLEELGVDFYKTGSGELTNLPLIEHVARTGKPLIMSTGMSTVEEVRESVELVKSIGTPLILTHCVSIYPCPHERVNLGMIPRYMEMFEVPVGLSDHTSDPWSGIGSVAVGACCVEKHFTLNKMAPGPDHASSLEPFELKALVDGARAVFDAMGSERRIFEEEEQIVAWARESVVSVADIPKGEKITEKMVWVKRPSPGPGVVPARDLQRVIGSVATTDIPRDTQIRWDQLDA
jgi:N-acetylneuraminate synthase